MIYFVGDGAGDTIANRAYQCGVADRRRSAVTLVEIIATGLRDYGNSAEGAGSKQEDRVGHIARWLADRIDDATLTLTTGVVLDMRADVLGKMIQDRVRRGGVVIRIEELDGTSHDSGTAA